MDVRPLEGGLSSFRYPAVASTIDTDIDTESVCETGQESSPIQEIASSHVPHMHRSSISGKLEMAWKFHELIVTEQNTVYRAKEWALGIDRMGPGLREQAPRGG